ncbi:MAG: hypothetical protein FD153_4 [Rhodospirillaceae bacterium]|nr:MAG: hypothetical protein FD153_4 [Rhodospirillaceae bacterium]
MAKDDSTLSLIGHIASLIGTAVGGAAAFAGAIAARRLMKPKPTVPPQGVATVPVIPADVASTEAEFPVILAQARQTGRAELFSIGSTSQSTMEDSV